MNDGSASEQAVELETRRIRAVYGKRDLRRARGALAEAYRLVNDDRLSRTSQLLRSLVPMQYPSILDVGCGTGNDLGYWLAGGWPTNRLAGVDLVPNRVAAARERCPGVDVRLTDGARLPFPDATFEIATAVVVFSSILDDSVRHLLFSEMRRVVKPSGHLVIYDFVGRKPWNPDVEALGHARLGALGGTPTGSVRLTPLLQLVRAGCALHPSLARAAMRVAPRTHRLSWWTVAPAPGVTVASP
jgi:SAM-dependent methyltransferase